MGLRSALVRILPRRFVEYVHRRRVAAERGRKRAEIESSAPRVSAADLERDLRNLGVKEGDLVMAWSALSALGYVEGGPAAVVDAILAAIGPTGTLVMPAFLVHRGMLTQVESGEVFDPKTTGTTLGAINRNFLAREGVHRSIHPTHSVAALGPRAAEVTAGHERAETTFGRGSAYEKLLERDVRCLGLGVSVAYPTFYHTFEDQTDAFPVRTYLPGTRTCRYRAADGEIHTMEVTVHDPDLSKDRIDNRPNIAAAFLAHFRDKGIIRTGPVGASESWLMGAGDFVRVLGELLADGITIYDRPV